MTIDRTETILAEDAQLASLDFDVDQDEDAALAEAAQELKPKFLIVERSLAAQFADGTRVKVSFNISTEEFRATFGNLDEDDSIGQMDALLGLMGPQAATIKAQGFITSMLFATKFFECWQKLVGATPGESKRSSN